MRSLFSSTSLLLAGVILAAAASAADPVYKWIDSTGHSHYSQTVPQGQKYQTITPAGTVTDTAAATPAPATAATAGATPAKPAANSPTPAQIARQKLCESAHTNVQVLTNSPSVNLDIYGNGKPQQLTPAQQTEQLNKAQRQVETYCK